MKRTWVWLAGVLLACGGMASAMTADELAKTTGIAGGVCCFPRAGQADEKLAAELAKRPTMIVHLLTQDAQAVSRIADAAEADGTLGRSLYVEKGGPAPLPLADRLVDVLVVSDLRDADLTPVLKAELLRVLAPRRGAALVGRAKDAGAGLTADALKAWAKDLPLAKVIADESGLWALLRTDLPAGSDPWNHRCHGPDNTQVSNDTTLKPPFLTQWWGMPRQEGFWGTTVVAGNGRLFSMRSSRNSNDPVYLTARTLTNGTVLWQRLLRQAPPTEKVPHGGYMPGRSSMVAAGGSLYLVDRDGVLCLDGETGQQRGRIAGPKEGGQVKWLAAAGGVLAVLSGESDTMTPIAYQTVAGNPTGRELAVYDIESSRVLWKDALGGDVDERLIVVRDDRIYALVQGVGMVCRELRTGKGVWTNTDPDIQADFRTPTNKIVDQLLASQPALMALDDVLLLRARWAKDLVSLSRTDGAILWRKPSGGGGRSLTALAVNGMWLGGGPPTDLKTGKPTQGPRFVSSGCGPTTAVPGLLITCFGTVADMATGKVIRNDDIKSPCDVGTLVSEGMMVTVPSQCGCNYEVKGYRALTSAGTFQPHTASPWKDRLTAGDAAAPAALAVTEADWPTYRRDAQRSAATSATVGGEQPKVLWQWKPAGAVPYKETSAAPTGARLTADFLATAPVAAAGNVYFASHDGTVRCVKADTGKEVWKFLTGAMVFAPPTIWQGRALVGGGDGRVYCLDASTGRCLWRLQAAPAERRVTWFGHLISTWPVVSGVVVQDGVAYAVAGFQKENGIHAYAIDPASGQVLWEKDDAGAGGGDPRAGLGSIGHAAIAGGKLWLSSAPAGCFDLKTGERKVVVGEQFGGEIAVLGDKWVLQGGRRLSETQDTLTHPLGACGFAACSAEAQNARVQLVDTGTTLPAWDAELAIVPPKGLGGPLTAVPTAKLLAWMTDRVAAQAAAAKVRAGEPKPKLPEWADDKTWAGEPITPVAFALAKDQVVVAHQAAAAYKVTGFRRADGSKAWTVDLPDQPAMNRLAVDRDGRVIVSLCDGSVVCLGR
jgi:outer membrane protein assembly factor BamB